jgi:hypothetical protein
MKRVAFEEPVSRGETNLAGRDLRDVPANDSILR